MEEKQEKEKGNFWLTVASFIVNKRKAIEILFVLAMIYRPVLQRRCPARPQKA